LYLPDKNYGMEDFRTWATQPNPTSLLNPPMPPAPTAPTNSINPIEEENLEDDYYLDSLEDYAHTCYLLLGSIANMQQGMHVGQKAKWAQDMVCAPLPPPPPPPSPPPSPPPPPLITNQPPPPSRTATATPSPPPPPPSGPAGHALPPAERVSRERVSQW
jgi:hypothetical protein